MRDPMLTGILSFIVPGVGQLYNGRILAGASSWAKGLIGWEAAFQKLDKER